MFRPTRLSIADPAGCRFGWPPGPGRVSRPRFPTPFGFTPAVVQPTFAVREPVLTIKPGTVLISETHWGGYFSPEGGCLPR